MKYPATTALLLLTSCSHTLKPQNFTDTGQFNPITFFTGHVTSWGVEENRGGQPTGIVFTDCMGTADPAGGINMRQILDLPDGKTQTRTWHVSQTAANQFTATANDMAGTTTGTTGGRTMHWIWILETSPGNSLANVTMDQWFYQMRDNSVVIRTTVSKAGINVLQITEQFEHSPN